MDYYSNMLGVLIEQQVLQHFMEAKFENLCKHLSQRGVFFTFLVFEWLICLFVNNVKLEV